MYSQLFIPPKQVIQKRSLLKNAPLWKRIGNVRTPLLEKIFLLEVSAEQNFPESANVDQLFEPLIKDFVKSGPTMQFVNIFKISMNFISVDQQKILAAIVIERICKKPRFTCKEDLLLINLLIPTPEHFKQPSKQTF